MFAGEGAIKISQYPRLTCILFDHFRQAILEEGEERNYIVDELTQLSFPGLRGEQLSILELVLSL